MEMMIGSCSFARFVRETIRMRNEAQEEKTIWEIWLHRVNGMGYREFRESLKTGKQQEMTEDEIRNTVQDSFEMLNAFVPDDFEERG